MAASGKGVGMFVLAENPMEFVSKEAVPVLYFLLPGFVAAWIFYGLTAHPKKETFERVVQALIFTVIVKAMNIVIHSLWLVWQVKDDWSADAELVSSVCNSILLGVCFAAIANWDFAHFWLRKYGITKRTSYPSEWYSGFHRFRTDVILHLKGERRLKGWADEWPDQCDKGHFLIQSPVWLDDEGGMTPFTQVKRLMIPAREVEMVEFLFEVDELSKTVEEIKKEQEPLVAIHRNLKESSNGQQAAAESGSPAVANGSVLPAAGANPVVPAAPDYAPLGGSTRSLCERSEARKRSSLS
jgi:hypothetical protein